MFAGEHINTTEDRAVLHTALRRPEGSSPALEVDGQNVDEDVHAVLARIYDFADRVRSGEWTGISGKRIETVVNIGIGGSDLGPAEQETRVHAALVAQGASAVLVVGFPILLAASTDPREYAAAAPLLLAISRKDFIGETLGLEADDRLVLLDREVIVEEIGPVAGFAEPNQIASAMNLRSSAYINACR